MSMTPEQKAFYETYKLILFDFDRNTLQLNTPKEKVKELALSYAENPPNFNRYVERACRVLGWQVTNLEELKAKLGVI